MSKGMIKICKRRNKKITFPRYCIKQFYNDGRKGALFCEYYDFLDKKCLYNARENK